MTEVRTQIERVIGRELEREQRAGVPHFKPGQIHVERIDAIEDDVAELLELADEPVLAKLSFVGADGAAWALFCAYFGDPQWWVVVYALTGGQTFVHEKDPPPLIGARLDALNAILDPEGAKHA